MALRIETEPLGDAQAVAIRCHGDLDAHTFEHLDEAINAAFDEGTRLLAVDLSGVPYMSSAGIGVLIGSRTEAEDRGGKLVLVNPTATVRDVFESMGFDAVFEIAQDDANALKMLGGAGESAAPADTDAAQEVGRERGRRKGFDF